MCDTRFDLWRPQTDVGWSPSRPGPTQEWDSLCWMRNLLPQRRGNVLAFWCEVWPKLQLWWSGKVSTKWNHPNENISLIICKETVQQFRNYKQKWKLSFTAVKLSSCNSKLQHWYSLWAGISLHRNARNHNCRIFVGLIFSEFPTKCYNEILHFNLGCVNCMWCEYNNC